jgi:hypothetical protein
MEINIGLDPNVLQMKILSDQSANSLCNWTAIMGGGGEGGREGLSIIHPV